MDESTGIPLGAFAIFFCLGAYTLFKASTGRRAWSWGRGGGEVPLSRASHFLVAFAFFQIAAIVATAPRPPLWLAALFGVTFILIIASGFFDAHKYSRNNRPGPPGRGGAQ